MGAGNEDRVRFIIAYDTDNKIKDLQKITAGKADEVSGQ